MAEAVNGQDVAQDESDPVIEESEFADWAPDEESEEDVEIPKSDQVNRAVVAGSDWTTETLLNQLRKNNIDLNPSFQRREVWTGKRKSLFIESILLNLPIPQIVLAEKKNQPNTYLVLDGKQRLLTLRQFAADPGIHSTDEPFKPLRLSGLAVREKLNGKTLRAMRESGDYSADVNAFDNHTIRTVVIRNWPDDNFLFRVFLRLNTGSVPLSPQELRQALIPGPFLDFADEFAIESEALKEALRIRKPDFRMRDTEVLVRFFGFANFLPMYRGSLKHFLDVTCSRLNDAWADGEATIRDQASSCEAAIRATIDLFPERRAFRRWRNGRYEGLFNRAVYDVMTFYFADPAIREAALKAGSLVEKAFTELCSQDRDFVDAITTSTKSIGATSYRLEAWGAALSSAAETPITIPGVGTAVE